ncbi:MerR family transcriptional regulator [Carbonactinospora thermoautotrophica]|uniref:MerR family transcriptional regulator n=1 Tax=Carbonactinospora thermoautotrophica TaxID=1469144 RepID=UPI00227183B7|nr:MerR family transcriptional regulator [Carbonactinospora thermoautotrophica]MCX9190453.1 MerR family transcriptional regulator [Carbonactinospora thermoautotrophica]
MRGGPALTVSAVARRLGVAPATLRTWARRYGLEPSGHVAGAHRRYTPADIARLETMHRLMLDGVSAAEAARAALALDVEDVGPEKVLEEPPRPRPRRRGGPVPRLRDGIPAARGLARAAMALDTPAVAELLAGSIEQRGVIWTWDNLLVPVLIATGERCASSGEGIEVEHALTDCAMAVLRRGLERLRQPANARPVLLSCVAEEQHSLPLYAVAAALAERRVASRLLGARVPATAAAAAVRRIGPAAVFLWARMPGYGTAEYVRALPRTRPASVVVVGGPGWAGARLPYGIRTVVDLSEATHALLAAVGL